MSGIWETVNLRTQLIGHNRLEILLFYLNGGARYGINVFKVNEVLQRPALVRLPKAHPLVCGVASLRGRTIPVIDLAKAIGQRPLFDEAGGIVIVTEYNRSTQGFLVRAVERIVNINWEKVMPPPEGIGNQHFLTAVARVGDEMVEMIDVERVLGMVTAGRPGEHGAAGGAEGRNHLVLVVEDSQVACNRIRATLDRLGIESHLCRNGREAYDQLLDWLTHDREKFRRLAMVISDIEMPEMDGSTLTARIRAHEGLRDLHIILHTSLSGLFNNDLIRQVDADAFVPKFESGELAEQIMKRIDALNRNAGQAA